MCLKLTPQSVGRVGYDLRLCQELFLVLLVILPLQPYLVWLGLLVLIEYL